VKLRTAGTAMLLAAALLAAGCRRAPVAVPRRTAYPRIAEHDTAMRRLGTDTLPGLDFAVNAAAVLASERPGWLDIRYPDYGATVHITLTRARGPQLAEVRANRLERLMLNIGDRPARRGEWVNEAGVDILETYSVPAAIPYQFLATDGEGYVLSGALYFADPRAAAEADSIRPMAEAIAADIHRALISLDAR